MARIQFGQGVSIGSVALRGAFGGKFKFEHPRFGTGCVCCNKNPMGRTQDYDASTDRLSADPVTMPVCFECSKHAFATHTGPMLLACLLCVGIAATALGAIYLDKRPHDTFLWGTLAVGVTMMVSAVALIVRAHRKEKRERAIPGHHARLVFSIDTGKTMLITMNETLADELIALNPSARRVLTRADQKRIPEARVVAGVSTPGDKDDQARLIAQRVLAGAPEDLDLVRQLIATGTVSHVLVDGLLAELEQLLGRADLRRRYRGLRDAGGTPTV